MTHPILSLAAVLQTQWDALIAAIRTAHEAKEAISEALATARVEHARHMLNEWETRADLHHLYRDFIGQLVAGMKSYLADAGTPLEVEKPDDAWAAAPSYRDSELELEDFYRVELDFAATVSLRAAGDQLAARYPAELARQASLTAAANRVFDYFAPSRWEQTPRPIVERAGRKVLSRELYGGYDWNLSHDTRTQLRRLFGDIAQLLADQGSPTAVADGDSHAMQFLFARGRYASRDSWEMGAGLRVVLFKEKIEFHFAPAVLDSLQVAIATHRTPAREAA